ncbi:MAG: c-type cytochrome [Halarcobacter sp.]
MKKIVLLTSILACVAFANPYAKCVACHGANGEKVALGKSKVMKDMTKAEIMTSLKGYKDGTYGGPMKGVMIPQVKSLSDADIEAIANQIGK